MHRRRSRPLVLPLLAAVVLLLIGTASPGTSARAAEATPPTPVCPLESTVRIESDTPIWEDDPVVTPRKRAWEDGYGGEVAARPFVRARLKGWPAALLIDRTTLPADDRLLLERLARDTWRGIDAATDKENGLPVDHVRLEAGAATPPTGRVGDYTNVTNIGLHFIAIVAAAELGLVTPSEAVAAIERT